ncbi:PQQ-dependent sugar dehydrogenase [Fulvivirgaceae bacterium BMA10]|uniref:PQQ-dependent sugar dehydrogenase n=1 Tax=Splendidivirga corallicola TaxID=3051826 RepID=A0ABT8KQU3_9BACT|nr:PQQ-dependent sugar dehydrogenase [Fulvivirgaceae bacterium BMA10]
MKTGNTKRLTKRSIIYLVILLSNIKIAIANDQHDKEPYEWKKDWLIEDGFRIDIDIKGIDLPTALAFVPSPGNDPKDPLYFIAELRGKIKVVTNDRTVYTFADLTDDSFNFTPKEELPSGLGQGGLAGIGLDPVNGYVFVTFLYRDESNIMRNNIMRFKTIPEKFAINPTERKAFTEIFNSYESGLAHHIGPCLVKDGLLYVSLGEAWQSFKTQQIDQLFGKIIRMTLDGEPVADNPFYQNNDHALAQNYVWARGLRNAFGLKFVNDRLFAADNGLNIDRFIEIFRGENYFWNGNDNSIAMNADFVWTPAVGPVQMDFVSKQTALFPEEYSESFFIALSGMHEAGKMPGIFMINYNLEKSRIPEVPKHFLKYVGESWQMVTGLAVGPDGLYFTPIFPDENGESKVLKITYDSLASHPYSIIQNNNPFSLLVERGCVGCHSIDGTYDYGGGAAPPLFRGKKLVRRIAAKLFSEGYKKSLEEVDKLSDDQHLAYKEARKNIMIAKDSAERVKLWIENFLQEPQFDKTYQVQMPNLGLTKDEASLLAEFLVKKGTKEKRKKGVIETMKYLITPPYGIKHLVVIFIAGFIFCFSTVIFFRRKKTRVG